MKLDLFFLKFAVILLVCCCGDGVAIAQKSNGESTYSLKGKLVVTAYNETQLLAGLELYDNEESVHLIIGDNLLKQLSHLDRFEAVKYFTLEFSSWIFEENNYYSTSDSVLNLDFLEGMINLEALVIDWEGETINLEALLKLSKLKFARLPFSTFDPRLFDSDLHYLEFGDRGDYIFTRSDQIRKVELPGDNYQIGFSPKENTTMRKFLKESRNDEKNHWEIPHVLINVEDTVFVYMESGEVANWCFKGRNSSRNFLDGSYNKDLLKRSHTFNIGNDYSRIIRTFIETNGGYEISIKKEKNGDCERFVSFGYKDGFRHGKFASGCSDENYEESIYNQGEVVYEYSNSILTIPYEDRYFGMEPFGNLWTNYKGIEYEDGKITHLTIYSNHKYNAEAKKLVDAPFKQGVPNGKILMFGNSGDTLSEINYDNGLLQGTFTSTSIFGSDTVRNTLEYKDGKLNGTSIDLSLNHDVYRTYLNDTIYLSQVARKSDGFVLEEKRLYPEKKYYESKFWRNDKVLYRVIRTDLNNKIIFSKDYARVPMDNSPPPP